MPPILEGIVTKSTPHVVFVWEFVTFDERLVVHHAPPPPETSGPFRGGSATELVLPPPQQGEIQEYLAHKKQLPLLGPP